MSQNILSPGYDNSTTVRNAYSNYTVYLAPSHPGMHCEKVYLNYIPNLYPLHTQCIPFAYSNEDPDVLGSTINFVTPKKT